MTSPGIDFDLREGEVSFFAIRAQGAGGQNVNKVSNAIHLRFDVRASSLPEELKARLLRKRDQRVTADGVIVIKAQQYRSLEKNRAEALARLRAFVKSVAATPRPRRATRPTASSQRQRIDSKVRRGQIKTARGRVHD
jgi:ribosome-associated protein